MLKSPRAWQVGALALLTIASWTAVRAYEPIRVSGGSMEPALYSGDLVMVAKGRPASVGDIVLLTPDGRGPLLHRIVDLEPDGVARTQGDANEASDVTPADPEDVEGPVVGVVPVGRVLSRWRRD